MECVRFRLPVLFLIFNRPETTYRVFQEIRKARPEKLFVAADGPRENRAGEAEKCLAARAIIHQVDWDCEIHVNFREKNLGLKLAVSSAITWFFEHVEEGIILEDDCLPTQSFFRFCQELLEKYRDDERVMCISGNNFQYGRKRGDGSYYFSRLATIWGWATWRRAWRLFDLETRTFPQFKEQNQIKNLLRDKMAESFWMSKIEGAHAGDNTWGFPWVYALLSHNGLCVTPNVNLVSNCGFGPDAVHAVDPKSRFSNIASVEMGHISHPLFILPDVVADEYFSRVVASEQADKISLVIRLKSLMKAIMGNHNYQILKKWFKTVRL